MSKKDENPLLHDQEGRRMFLKVTFLTFETMRQALGSTQVEDGVEPIDVKHQGGWFIFPKVIILTFEMLH